MGESPRSRPPQSGELAATAFALEHRGIPKLLEPADGAGRVTQMSRGCGQPRLARSRWGKRPGIETNQKTLPAFTASGARPMPSPPDEAESLQRGTAVQARTRR